MIKDVDNHQMEEMCRVWYVEKGTEFPNPLQALLSQYLTWSSTWKLFKPHLCGGFMEKSLHRHGYLLTIGYWFNLQPLSPPQRLGHLGLNGQEAWMKTKIYEKCFSSKWPSFFVFLINHSIATCISVLVGFSPEMRKTTLPTHKAGWKGWVGIETGPTLRTNLQPMADGNWHRYAHAFMAEGLSLRAMFHSIPLRSASVFHWLHNGILTYYTPLVYSYPYPHASVSKIFQKATKYFHLVFYLSVCPWRKHKLR